MDPKPTTSELQDVVTLLEHPLVGAIIATKGGYRPVDAPEVMHKFNALGKQMGVIDAI